MILGTGEPTVTVHTEKKIKRKRNGGGNVAKVTEPEEICAESHSSNAEV